MSPVHALTVYTNPPFSPPSLIRLGRAGCPFFHFLSFAARGVAWSFFASLYAPEAFISLASPSIVFPPRYVDTLVYVYILVLTTG